MQVAKKEISIFIRLLFGCMLLGTFFTAFALDHDPDLPYDPAEVSDFCNLYENITDTEQIKTIQEKLKAGGYYLGEINEKMDASTKAALRRLCKDSGDVEPFKYLAANPIPLLDEPTDDICDVTMIDKAFRTLSQAKVRTIQTQLQIGGYDPGKIDGWTGDDTDLALAKLCVEYKVDEYLKNSEVTEDDLSSGLVERLTELLDTPPPINLVGEDCACSRDFSALVYGFYPYLLSSGEAQAIDFSLFDRLGFHALMLSLDGEVEDEVHWRENMNVADFIHEAHKFRVKVDVTFYAAGWQEWDYGIRDKAAENIVATVNREFKSSDTSLWRKTLRWMEGMSKVSVDGVNLYFDYSSPGSGDSKKLVDIVTKVSKKLKNAESKARLNIMLGLDLDQESIDKKQFAKLKKILAGDTEMVDYVFIFLPRNDSQSRSKTSRSKKKLRQIVENAFHGDNRVTVLRKIVPIISPAATDFKPLSINEKGGSQFDDDLLYMKDNFFGVGLWPSPLKSNKYEEKIRSALIENYRSDDDLNYLGYWLEDHAPEVCKFVCPNRLYFRIGLGLLVGILLIYALLAVGNYRLRVFYQRHFLYFLALLITVPLIFVITLVCDPTAEKYVDRVVNGILLLFLAGFVWRNVRKAVQPKLP